ncbi:DNA methyltransferase [Salinisphaera hydrothermalis]|uniref:site-specific DNA-methyltransferase (adenine-specific) n=1 Tax=Salinisphaera hydrothermalis (strain C41B8) TaxID=1304275 RepID=A0A084IHE9_SALHC|nr:DNA methyltransferase [Salinisphaera hydrothermalis]KEZ76133.1 DNA methyltransferase [Salinisphaera hydrothermalis C41B8]
MPLSWNDIRANATSFAHDWADAANERADAQTFWNEFFEVFGIKRRQVATFEKHVQKFGDASAHGNGFIDCFWPGTLIAEHKSRGKDLDSAFIQAVDYTAYLKPRDLPQYIVVSDFARIRLHDLVNDEEHEFALAELPRQIKRFGFIAGYKPQVLRAEDPVNVDAAERMGKLHDALKASGYTGHKLEMLLVRLLFCLFAEDTGIFQPAQAFRLWLEERTAEDGSDLGSKIAHVFQILDTPHQQRQKSLDEQLAAFPYVNGDLFTETLPIPAFDRDMRDALLDACGLDWSQISPAVFGAMFQSIMDSEARRNLGAHYTSEQNIEKLIKPLFLDELRAEFERVKHNRNRLFEFHKKLRTLTFLDPACGCGNFLVVTYRALRELELDVLRAASTGSGQLSLDVHGFINIDVDQFFGIEIEEFPARIAEVALWLTDHQMNVKVGEEFGMYFARIPLRATPHIHNANALRLDWEDVVPKERLSYILGNPPFGGKRYQSKFQKADLQSVTGHIKGSGTLDFVTGWFVKASELLAREPDRAAGRPPIRCAFVSTNSIAQGEQVSLLWPEMLRRGVKIQFAHRTFRWSNEARGKAAVHCIIVGFGLDDTSQKILFEYDDINGLPQGKPVKNINPYLVDAPDVVIASRRQPICNVPHVSFGSMPNDGGNLILSDVEKAELLICEPSAESWVQRYLGSEEFLHDIKRWCLWLEDLPPARLKELPRVRERVQAVRNKRLESSRLATQRLADVPTLFGENRQPEGPYLAIPKTSSERRPYLPIAFRDSEIASTELFTIPDAKIFHFGIITSMMHAAWMRYTCGRLKSDFRYSAGLVYNNFPWPQDLSHNQCEAVEAAATVVLDARAQFPDATLADLYDPLTMPPALLKAHRKLDRAVDAAYARKKFSGDADRVAFLFEEYAKLTQLPEKRPAAKQRRRG